MTNPKHWLCIDCQKHLTKTEAIEHSRLNHRIKLHIPIEERLVYNTNGFCQVVDFDGRKYGIQPILMIYKDPLTKAEEYSNTQLSLMSEIHPFRFVGQAVILGDIQNVAKKLSYGAGQQSRFISTEELSELFINAIKNGKASLLKGNNFQVLLTLSTSLTNKKPEKSSKWVCVTWREIESTISNPETIEAIVSKRARLLKNLAPFVGGS